MGEDNSPRALMKAWMNARMRDDEDALRAMLHPDFVLEDPPSVPWGGRYEGHEGYFRFWAALNAAVTDMAMSITGVFENGRQPELIVAMALSGRSVATGRTFSTELVERWSFADGKLIGFKPFFFDTAALLPVFA